MNLKNIKIELKEIEKEVSVINKKLTAISDILGIETERGCKNEV